MHKKNIKKGFFVNNKKYILSFILLGILSTFCHATDEVTPTTKSDTKESLANQHTTSQKKVKKRKSHRCPYSNMPLKKLTAEQLEEVYTYTQTHKMDAAFMVDLLERLIALSDNHAGVKQYKLQLADLHYSVHHLEKAAACYEDFAVMYPGSKEHEYVLYKALICMFELSLDADRDQTNTKKTINLTKEFLKHAQTQDLITQAKEVLQKCYDRLFDHEVYVFNFYSKKKNFVAAQKRLDYTIKNFPTLIQDHSKKIDELTNALKAAQNPTKPSKKYLTKKFIA